MSFLHLSDESVQEKQLPTLLIRIWLGACIGILPLFALPLTRDALNFPKIFLLGIFVIVAALGWLLLVILFKETTIRRSAIDPLLFIFLIGVLLSSLFSKAPGGSFLGRPDLFTTSFLFLLLCAALVWLIVQVFHNEGQVLWLLRLMLVSLIIAALIFIFRSTPILQKVVGTLGWNFVSPIHSIFSMILAVGSIISAGLLLLHKQQKWLQCIPALGLLVCFIALLQLNFRVSWVVYLVGIGVLVALGASIIQLTSIARVSIIFIFFLLGLCAMLLPLPSEFRASLPIEIALGSGASWDIVRPAWLHSAKTFFLGSGPGSFRIDFSQYRGAAFNADSLTWTTRFAIPFNTPFAFLSEIGLIGFLGIASLFLVVLGNVISGWWRVRKAFVDVPRNLSQACGPEYATPSVIAVAWLSTTLALFLSYADVILWFFWWTLLALLLVSQSRVITGIIKQTAVRFSVSSQYALLFSFALILLGFSVILLGVFGYRVYASEFFFTKAVATTDIDVQAQHVTRALSYRPGYPEYQLADARVGIERVRRLAASDVSQPDSIAQELSHAVDITKSITQKHPYNIEAWELLSVIYMNTRLITPEANTWAKDTLTKAIALEPSNPLFYWRRANVEAFEKDFAAAETSYMRAIELKPDYVLAYTDLSVLYEQQGDLTRAINIYQPVMPLVQDNADLLFALGRLFYNRNSEDDFDRAEQLWLRAQEIDPRHSNSLYSLGLLYERQGRKTLAKEYIARVQELNPDNEDVTKKLKSL